MTQQTVGQIAAETPAAVRVFEKYGIDYCCGGQRPLGDVCRERGLAAEAVMDEVAGAGRSASAGADWKTASLGALIGHIVRTHHEYVKTETPLLTARLAKVVEVHGKKYPKALPPLQQVFHSVAEELDSHMRKEEFILFPAIEDMENGKPENAPRRPLPFGTVRNPIRMMVHEHDSAGAALAEMRRLTGNYTLPPDACATFRALYQGLQEFEADLHQHIHLENNILFPRAAELEASL